MKRLLKEKKDWTMKMLRNICAVGFVLVVGWVLCLGGYFFVNEVIFENDVEICISPSMAPLIKANGLVVIDDSFPFKDIEVGDIILFEAGIGRYVNHRVHQVTELNGKKAVMTVGDNNMMVDEWVTTEEEYIGKIVGNTNSFKPIADWVCGNIAEMNLCRMLGHSIVLILFIIVLFVLVFVFDIKYKKNIEGGKRNEK